MVPIRPYRVIKATDPSDFYRNEECFCVERTDYADSSGQNPVVAIDGGTRFTDEEARELCDLLNRLAKARLRRHGIMT